MASYSYFEGSSRALLNWQLWSLILYTIEREDSEMGRVLRVGIRRSEAEAHTLGIMTPPHWSRPFRCHTDVCHMVIGSTLTLTGKEGDEHPILLFWNRLLPAEENYYRKIWELLGLIQFFQLFCCYFEGREFEIRPDNQIPNFFFSKPTLSKLEARWLEILENFGISNTSLVKRKAHVIGDSLSHAPQMLAKSH